MGCLFWRNGTIRGLLCYSFICLFLLFCIWICQIIGIDSFFIGCVFDWISITFFAWVPRRDRGKYLQMGLDSIHSFLFEGNGHTFVNDTAGVVSSTLENPNYVGSYVVLVLPYCGHLLLRGGRLWRRILAGVTLDLLGIFLYGSESDTDMVAFAAGVCVMLFFVFPDMKKTPEYSLHLLAELL